MKMACMTGWMAGIVAALCCPADVSGETAEKPWFVFNEDFGNYCVSCGYVKPEKKDLDMLPNVGVFPFGVEGLRAYIDAIARGKVTHFAMCMNAQRPCFPSKTIEPVWSELDSPDRDRSPIAVTEKALVDRGIDRYAVWIARCRERGVSPWLSVRMNDMHGGDDPRSPLISTFWREHPEYRRLPDPTKLGRQSFWKLFSLDYSHVEVRERMLAFLGECMDRYDADGLDLDFTRFVWYLTPGREREQAPLLTDFMRKVRALVSSAAARRGHPILLSVRTVSSPDVVEACGLDLPTWAKEGLVDVVSVCNHFQTADYEIPVDTWRNRLGPRVRLLTGIDYGLRVNGIRSFLTREEYLGWADVMRSRGVGDFYFYNLYGYDYASDIWHRSLTNGFDAAAVAGAPRAYPLSYRDQGHPDVRESYVSPWPVRLERPFACSLPVGSVPSGCKAELVLGFKSRPAELPAPRVNGHLAGNVRGFRREHVPHAIAFALNAADVRAGENRVEVPALPGVEIVYIALRIDPTAGAVEK